MQYSTPEEKKRFEVGWAVSILENPSRFQTNDYRETIKTADIIIRKYGYTEWQQAKAWLVPGWKTTPAREAYL